MTTNMRGYLNGIGEARSNLKALNPKPPQKRARLKIRNGADIERKDYEWIWPEMLAKGELHIFSGEGGVGKTQIAIDLAARITNGDRFPNSGVSCDAGTVLYVSCEDDLEKTIMPRFDACGGCEENFDILDSQLISGEKFVLSEVLDELAEHVVDREYQFIVVDPVTALLPEKFDNNSTTDVRHQLHPIQMWTQKYDVAMLGIAHLTKNSQTKIAHRTVGSGAWIQAPRIAWAAAEHEDELVFGKAKQNITAGKGVYKYAIKEAFVDGLDQPRACVQWLEDAYNSDVSLNKLLDMPVVPRDAHGHRAKELIQDKLRNGTFAEKQEVIAYVQREVPISERQIERLAKDMHIQTKRQNNQNGSAIWSLPT